MKTIPSYKLTKKQHTKTTHCKSRKEQLNQCTLLPISYHSYHFWKLSSYLLIFKTCPIWLPFFLLKNQIHIIQLMPKCHTLLPYHNMSMPKCQNKVEARCCFYLQLTFALINLYFNLLSAHGQPNTFLLCTRIPTLPTFVKPRLFHAGIHQPTIRFGNWMDWWPSW